jgi:antitoxin MazE
MEVAIRKMGNSQGVLLPKPLLAQAGLTDRAELRLRGGVIELRAPKAAARAGWAEDARRIAGAGDDRLAWPEFGNAGDDKLTW